MRHVCVSRRYRSLESEENKQDVKPYKNMVNLLIWRRKRDKRFINVGKIYRSKTLTLFTPRVPSVVVKSVLYGIPIFVQALIKSLEPSETELK